MAVWAKWSKEDQVVLCDVSVVNNSAESEDKIFVEGGGQPYPHKEDEWCFHRFQMVL